MGMERNNNRKERASGKKRNRNKMGKKSNEKHQNGMFHLEKKVLHGFFFSFSFF